MPCYRLDLKAEQSALATAADDAFAGGNFVGLPIPPDRWAGVIAKATVYRARVGRCRVFQSAEDMLAYERGYDRPWDDHPTGTPAFHGAMDRQQEIDASDAARIESATRSQQ